MSLAALTKELGARFQMEGGLTDSPLQERNGRVEGQFGELRLSSVFGRLRSAACPLLVEGLQAGLRVYADGDSPSSALDVFAAAQDTVAVINLDRLCRTLHLLNFLPLAHEAPRLFLYVNPHHVTGVKSNHGAYFEDMLARCGLGPERVVISVTLGHGAGRQSPALRQGLENYRARGYQLALQLKPRPGVEAVNFDLLRDTRPQYLLLPHGLGRSASSAELRERRLRLSSLTAIAHDLGAQVAVEGIETASQAELSVAAGADLVRGDYYESSRQARPHAEEHPGFFRNRPLSPAERAERQRSECSTLSLLGRRWQYS